MQISMRKFKKKKNRNINTETSFETFYVWIIKKKKEEESEYILDSTKKIDASIFYHKSRIALYYAHNTSLSSNLS